MKIHLEWGKQKTTSFFLRGGGGNHSSRSSRLPASSTFPKYESVSNSHGSSKCKSGATVLSSGRTSVNLGTPLAHKKRKCKCVRRGRKRHNHRENGHAQKSFPCVVYYANINGYKSKGDSQKQLLIENKVDILLLTETKVYRKTRIKIDGFQIYPVIRKKNCGGGILIGIRHGFCSFILVDEGVNAEFATVKLDFGVGQSIRIILVYGPQENDQVDKVKQFYENISLQVNRSLLAGDYVFLAGDMNAKLGKNLRVMCMT